jgi:hypothetical protein
VLARVRIAGVDLDDRAQRRLPQRPVARLGEEAEQDRRRVGQVDRDGERAQNVSPVRVS